MKFRSTIPHEPDATSGLRRAVVRGRSNGHVTPPTPRLLTRRQAAQYCGLSLHAFDTHCPVKSVSAGPDIRLSRFDVRALDHWIDSLGTKTTETDLDNSIDWLERMAP